MKALIVYATNSGGTRFASEFLSSKLSEKNHTVDMREAWEVPYDSFADYDVVFFGTNTWFYNDKEGQPHKWYLDRQKELEALKLPQMKCAVFALGDSSYAQFCHSADTLKGMLAKTQAKVLEPTLRIDGYYRDETRSESLLTEWLESLLNSLDVK